MAILSSFMKLQFRDASVARPEVQPVTLCQVRLSQQALTHGKQTRQGFRPMPANDERRSPGALPRCARGAPCAAKGAVTTLCPILPH
jgi:hypothetical protein